MVGFLIFQIKKVISCPEPAVPDLNRYETYLAELALLVLEVRNVTVGTAHLLQVHGADLGEGVCEVAVQRLGEVNFSQGLEHRAGTEARGSTCTGTRNHLRRLRDSISCTQARSCR